eukprot:gene1378-1498_t
MLSCSIDPNCNACLNKPFVDGAKVLCGGQVSPWSGHTEDVTSPIMDSETNQRLVIGRMAYMQESDAVQIVNAAKTAWNRGTGEWPQMTMKNRIAAVRRLVEELQKQRDAIIQVLMWEICKTTADATAEFDRTMAYIEASIDSLQMLDQEEVYCRSSGGMSAQMRRGPIGVMLVMGPFNYPFNETYTALIPALLMGNTIVMKIPKVGGLAHVLTMEAYASALPPGVVNFISGSGRETMAPVMEEGVDVFAFIGSAQAADILLNAHPQLHRLRVFLSLEGKNLGIVTHDADLNVAIEQCVLGATTFNGQRCTAIKLIFVDDRIAEPFVKQLADKVNTLVPGLPWEKGVNITPLPEADKVGYMSALLEDALSKGAKVVNEGGGKIIGNLFFPAVVYPVTPEMRLWKEEQFGPIVPVAVFNNGAVGETAVHDYIMSTKYGQQAAVFSQSPETIAHYIDFLAMAVGRININTQCGRSPDCLPFSGRRSSANGTLSVTEALRTFSVPIVVAGKANGNYEKLIDEAGKLSNFLAPL